jgi:hypothetical protein
MRNGPFRVLIVVALLLCGCGAAPAAGGRPAPSQSRTAPLPTWTPGFQPFPRNTSAPTWTPGAATLPPASFGFVFTSGTCVLSRVDTFAGTFSRAGTGVDPAVTVPLSLLPEDIQRIQRDTHQIDFFSYPADFTLAPPPGGALRTVTTFTPANSYVFAVREGARQHTVRWLDDVLGVPSQRADQLRALADLIERTVHGAPAVAALPDVHVGCA